MTITCTRSPLLPERHPEGDFFVCDILDAATKSDMASMEHPFFSLSTKPDMKARRYQHGDQFIEVKPSHEGMATIFDRDILIYCISQVIAARNEEKPYSQTVRFRAIDLMKATNRATSGAGYDGLKAALERLSGTRINTNITSGNVEVFETFGMIESAKIVRETREGRMQEVEVKLSDWVYNAIEARDVLTLSRDYFRLRKPIERRIYEIARKHCGQKSTWSIKLALLHKKCGSGSTIREFKRILKKVIDMDMQHNHMPDYAVRWTDELEEKVSFISRESIQALKPKKPITIEHKIFLDADAYDEARKVAPEWDIYHLEAQWRDWMAMSDNPSPKNPNRAFIGFCKKWFERKGRP